MKCPRRELQRRFIPEQVKCFLCGRPVKKEYKGSPRPYNLAIKVKSVG